MRPLLSLLAFALAGLSACGGTASHTRMEDPATLLAERDEWRGERSGPVALRMHIEALVDTRPDASKATSALVVHLAVAQFAEQAKPWRGEIDQKFGAQPAPIPITFPVPRGARFTTSEVRFVATTNTPAALVSAPISTPGERSNDGVDADQDVVALTLPAPPEGGVVEAILRFEVAGTLASDARWMGLVGMPVGELLLRYDLATDTVGTFQTTLPNARPIVTEKDGRRLIALLATNLAPITPSASAPYARYVTVRASPKGFDQTFSSDWSHTTAAYRARVLDISAALEDGYEVPYRPVGSGRPQVLDALAWVRGRPLRADPVVRWDATHALPLALAKNDITTVDRTHLLHWVLREAGIAHTLVMARNGSRPRLDAAFPVTGVFDAPLIYISDLGLVLDAACDDCAPGEVRPSLRGGQALALPVAAGTKSATFIALPIESSPRAPPRPKCTPSQRSRPPPPSPTSTGRRSRC